MLVDRLEPDAADVYDRAVAAAADRWGDGAVDDLVLLRGLLEVADDDLLKVMGPYLRTVLARIAADEADPTVSTEPRRVPYGEHLLDAALNEVIDLTGSAEEIRALHLVLALFFFPGCRATVILQRCGIEWRPLRSLARRLTGISYYDW